MENASNALIMAGGVLIGILILSLAVYLFVDFGSKSAEIYEQNAQAQLVQFNSKFTTYEGKEGLTIYDVITVAGYAYENNKYYSEDTNANYNDYKISVYFNRDRITGNSANNKANIAEDKFKIENIKNNVIQRQLAEININNLNLPTYNCTVEYNTTNGRVSSVNFN